MGLKKLENEISVAEKNINDTKIEIADLFLKIHDNCPKEKPTFNEFSNWVDDMVKMPDLIEKLRRYECRRNTLLASKHLIENSETEIFAKN